MKTVKQTYHIAVPAKKVWAALVDAKQINKWGGGPAKMSAKKDAEFSLWGGEIWGKNTAVVTEKKLAQEWWCKGWKEASELTFTLHKEKSVAGKIGTRVELLHKNVP